MLRDAIIKKLKAVPGLGGRIYEAFLAPHNAAPPYATVKMASQQRSTAIWYAGTQPVEVRVYNDMTSYKALDAIERDVVAALNDVELQDVDGNRYYIRWVAGGIDYTEDERKLIARLVNFEAAIIMERSRSHESDG